MTVASIDSHSKSGSDETASNIRLNTPAIDRTRQPKQRIQKPSSVTPRSAPAFALSRHKWLKPFPLIIPKHFTVQSYLFKSSLEAETKINNLLILIGADTRVLAQSRRPMDMIVKAARRTCSRPRSNDRECRCRMLRSGLNPWAHGEPPARQNGIDRAPAENPE
jgi:hypothetical protein